MQEYYAWSFKQIMSMCSPARLDRCRWLETPRKYHALLFSGCSGLERSSDSCPWLSISVVSPDNSENPIVFQKRFVLVTYNLFCTVWIFFSVYVCVCVCVCVCVSLSLSLSLSGGGGQYLGMGVGWVWARRFIVSLCAWRYHFDGVHFNFVWLSKMFSCFVQS